MPTVRKTVNLFIKHVQRICRNRFSLVIRALETKTNYVQIMFLNGSVSPSVWSNQLVVYRSIPLSYKRLLLRAGSSAWFLNLYKQKREDVAYFKAAKMPRSVELFISPTTRTDRPKFKWTLGLLLRQKDGFCAKNVLKTPCENSRGQVPCHATLSWTTQYRLHW